MHQLYMWQFSRQSFQTGISALVLATLCACSSAPDDRVQQGQQPVFSSPNPAMEDDFAGVQVQRYELGLYDMQPGEQQCYQSLLPRFSGYVQHQVTNTDGSRLMLEYQGRTVASKLAANLRRGLPVCGMQGDVVQQGYFFKVQSLGLATDEQRKQAAPLQPLSW